MSLLVNLNKTQFLNEYWQQKPLLINDAIVLEAFISGDDLAGLACEESVESRLIEGFGLNGDWCCQQGPFEEHIFSQLPEENWTLLIQGLDQFSEECQVILDAFDFLPRWRLEDIMASFAPKGGGVGPHFDYYDVFLIQLSGSRQWQLGQQCDENTPLQNNAEVKLLEQFHQQITHQVTAGDILYIPAGLAHWGVATSDDCITLSVGFRAPSEREMIGQILHALSDELLEQKRYQDSQASIDQHPYKINAAVTENLHQLTSIFKPQSVESHLLKSFGSLVTEPRYSSWLEENDTWTKQSFVDYFAANPSISFEHAPHARFAFSDEYLFANGESFFVKESFSRAVCDKALSGEVNDDELDVLIYLLNQSWLFIVE